MLVAYFKTLSCACELPSNVLRPSLSSSLRVEFQGGRLGEWDCEWHAEAEEVIEESRVGCPKVH